LLLITNRDKPLHSFGVHAVMTGSQTHLPPPAKCSEASTEMGHCLLPRSSQVRLWHVYVGTGVSVTGCRLQEILSFDFFFYFF
jgi:hypothetical protein